MSATARAAVLGWLSKRVGFPFTESELSPALRRRVGELAELNEQVYRRGGQISVLQDKIQLLAAKKKSDTTNMIILGIIGAALLIIIVGAFLFIAVYVLYQRRRKGEQQILEKNAEISRLRSEVASLNQDLDSKLSALSTEIYSEISTIHQMRVSGGSSGSTVQLVKETVREVVLVPCSYCHSLMPQTSTRCPNCGATRKT